mmetsp:Transcript_25175/g.54726  ORF Transcript_25175/g.54726 Transcript_25175/m.54726 type:complete len:92 (+) Transcript_25175:478-753(+)
MNTNPTLSSVRRIHTCIQHGHLCKEWQQVWNNIYGNGQTTHEHECFAAPRQPPPQHTHTQHCWRSGFLLQKHRVLYIHDNVSTKAVPRQYH